MLLDIRQLSKSYDRVEALRQVSFRIGHGELVGLVGENGAGKSTLLSIIAGFLRPDHGEIALDGIERRFRSPTEALDAGIGLVHQHLSLVPTFTVREQLRLAGWSQPQLPPILGTDIREDSLVEHLSPGQRQRLEIARVLVTSPRLILLDEPTSILAPPEVDALFEMLRAIRSEGVAVVIVTHKLREVLSFVDRVVVLTGGSVAGEFAKSDGSWLPGTDREILGAMFGIDPSRDTHGASEPERLGEAPPLLRVRGLGTDPAPDRLGLREIDLQLMPGQVHVVVGVDGQGQAGLADSLAGYVEHRGSIELDGVSIGHLGALERALSGIGLLSGDRLGEAGVVEATVAENLVLKRPRPPGLVRSGTFRRSAVLAFAHETIERWGVSGIDPGTSFGRLSGGNMQRLIAGRELARNPRVLVAVNPTQGLDSRTVDLLWTRFRMLCQAGNAVLALVSDLDEAIERADRIATIYDGRVSPLMPVAATSREALARQMVGG